MTDARSSNRVVKALLGGFVLACAVLLAVEVGRPRPRPQASKELLDKEVVSLPGVAAALSVTFDGIEYNGQGAARIVSVDLLLGKDAQPAAVGESMKAAGDAIRRYLDVYQKICVTGYRRAGDFKEGLAFQARALWLAPELAAPLDGWSVIRLPDEPLPLPRALDGVYARPVIVSATGGALVATVDLDAERRARPACGLGEILAEPLLDSFDHENAFQRCPELESLDVTVLAAGAKAARFVMTREVYLAKDLSAPLARLSKQALRISSKEFAIAERYERTDLFTPLLFDSIVSQEDKDEINALEAKRSEAQMEFYTELFAGGTWENTPGADAAAHPDSAAQSASP